MTKDGEVRHYVNLLTNSGFKAVFGDRANKDVVISVINALLPAHRQVTDIDYGPTEHQGRLLHNKEFRYDFMCKDADGVAFIVEVQCYPNDYWFQRCVSYASRAYERQNTRGEDYDHESSETWRNRYISEYTFMEKYSHELQDETIIIIFAELARFDKSLDECEDDVERMLYVLKNMGTLDRIPRSLHHEIFMRIFEACDRDNFSEDKRKQYDQDMYDEVRRLGELATARRMGREEGLAEGRAEGQKEGKEEARLEDARRFKELGVAVDIISQATGLSVETIESL